MVGVAQGDIDKTIETLRKQRVHYEPTERPAAKGDRITIDYRGTIGGEEFGGSKAENFTLVLGEGRLLKDFEEPLVGMSAGESKTFEVTFPEDYHGKEAAGKTAAFEVKLHEVKAPRVPEVDCRICDVLGNCGRQYRKVARGNSSQSRAGSIEQGQGAHEGTGNAVLA